MKTHEAIYAILEPLCKKHKLTAEACACDTNGVPKWIEVSNRREIQIGKITFTDTSLSVTGIALFMVDYVGDSFLNRKPPVSDSKDFLLSDPELINKLDNCLFWLPDID
jgi:hypothetical protein